jgi:LDH2 family malate/lactate/ureidoglycolate dehydrogenase
MPIISENQLRQMGIALLCAAGVSETEAQQTVALLIESNLVGHDSHGVIRIPTYIRQILSGQTQLGSPIEIMKETPTTALVNGGWGLGQVVATKTMELAIKKAETHNVGMVSTFNCQHIGRMADYVAMAAKQDMIGYCCVNSTPGVAPFGGIRRMFNQSPLGWGIPAGEEPPIILDISTSVCAGGKIAVARAREEKLPPGCIIDKEGYPSTDPEDYYRGGAGLPLGGRVGYKGFGLALVVDVLGGLLSGRGAAYLGGNRGQGLFQFALKIDAYRPIDEFKREMDALIRAVKMSPCAPGVSEILLPGDPERRMKVVRQQNGIPVSMQTWKALVETGAKIQVDVASFL